MWNEHSLHQDGSMLASKEDRMLHQELAGMTIEYHLEEICSDLFLTNTCELRQNENLYAGFMLNCTQYLTFSLSTKPSSLTLRAFSQLKSPTRTSQSPCQLALRTGASPLP